MKKIVVTKIINKYQFLINAGSDDGLDEYTKLQVVGSEESIIDPITKENLGTLIYPKLTVKISKLYPKMAICEDNHNHTEDYATRMLKSGILSSRYIQHEINFDIDDYAEQQLDKAIYIGDELRLLDKPKVQEQNTDENKQDAND